jgi:outer membrane translocation and assembly module TamA
VRCRPRASSASRTTTSPSTTSTASAALTSCRASTARSSGAGQALAGSLGYSLDLRALALTARVGAGSTFAQREQIETSALLGGFGLSAEYQTPLGPIMLGWGTSSHGGSRFYFGAGRSLRF